MSRYSYPEWTEKGTFQRKFCNFFPIRSLSCEQGHTAAIVFSLHTSGIFFRKEMFHLFLNVYTLVTHSLVTSLWLIALTFATYSMPATRDTELASN